MISKAEERIGEVGFNSSGNKMVIIEYNNALNIIVEFESGYKTKCQYTDFKKGNVKDAYERTAFGVGYLGDGHYKSKIRRKSTPYYHTWRHMLERCYSKKYQEKHPTYKGCVVAEEWHNFQNFAKWYEDNYYEVEGQIIDLDKDILVKGNKTYSPQTCVFAPQSINKLFTSRGTSEYTKERIEELKVLYKDYLPKNLYDIMTTEIANIV